jgi:hypothetical protein
MVGLQDGWKRSEVTGKDLESLALTSSSTVYPGDVFDLCSVGMEEKHAQICIL